MITEDYVSFEVAKLLKEKGFDVPLWFYYDQDKEIMLASWSGWEEDWNNCLINNEPSPFISAPTHQMAMKWLREVYGIFIQISAILQDQPFGLHYRPSIQDYHTYSRHDNFNEYITYEEAIEAALKYTLKNLI